MKVSHRDGRGRVYVTQVLCVEPGWGPSRGLPDPPTPVTPTVGALGGSGAAAGAAGGAGQGHARGDEQGVEAPEAVPRDKGMLRTRADTWKVKRQRTAPRAGTT